MAFSVKNGFLGSYIYFFGGRAVGNFPRSRAILMSEDMKRLPEQQYLCMTFNYFTNASGAAVIRVHLVQDPSDYNPLWETYGREPPATLLNGTIWHHAQIPVPQVPNGEDFLVCFWHFTEFLVRSSSFFLQLADHDRRSHLTRSGRDISYCD